MDIDHVRTIDYWLGVPLCFLLSVVHKIRRMMGRGPGPKAPQKILFIKLSELGAIILAYPLMESLKKEYPSAEFFFMTLDRNKGVFKILGGIVPEKNVIGIRETPAAFIRDAINGIKRLRSEKIDVIFDLEFFLRFPAVFSFLSGAEKRVGFYKYCFEGLYKGDLLTHKVQYNSLNHITRNYLSLAQTIKQDQKNTPQLEENVGGLVSFPQYVPDFKTKEKVLAKLSASGFKGSRRLFLLNPGEGMLPLREWPLENFITLSRLLLEDENNHLVLIGTDGAVQKSKQMMEALGSPRCSNLVGQTDLGELLSLFNIANDLVTNDCGLAHLAMLSPIKKFIIYGPESPEVFGALGDRTWIIYSHWPCSPCLSVLNHRKSTCTDNRCLKAIQPKDVYRLIADTQQTKG